MDAPPPPPASASFPRWPLWLPLAGLAVGLTFGLLLVSILAGATGASSDSPGLTAGGTVLIDISIVLSTLAFAGLVAPPRPWQLGLRGAPLKLTAGIAAIGIFAFFLFSLVYSAIVRPDEPQKVVDNLGADDSTVLLVSGALVVIVVAPLCEELFFRGFLFRVLRLRMAFWFAAVIDGLLFGLVHASSTSIAALPILAFLGLVFCWVYERTGTLFATIAMHALNNTISYGVATDNGWAAALSIGAVMIGACVVGVLRAPRGASVGPLPPAPPAAAPPPARV
jgi:membrane protease YdiL (CAAX protease family)